MDSPSSRPPLARLLVGIFLLSAGMLMFQVLLTRVLSVTMYYHFAFFAVSLAMFGLTLGAVLVDQNRAFFARQYTEAHLGWTALAFGWAVPAGFLAHMSIPFGNLDTLAGAFGAILVMGLLSLASTMGGICICLCLTRYPGIVGRLYAADLIGAAVGAVAILPILSRLNGPAAVLVILCLSALSSLVFIGKNSARRTASAACVTLAIGLATLAFELSRPIEKSLFRLIWIHGERAQMPRYERWNSFSRVTVSDMASVPFGWGLSRKYSPDARVDQLYLEIDAGASTPITRFDGSFDNLGHLKDDIINAVHYLRSNADVFVVGVGGGRDVLSALMFNQKSIEGAEINPHIIDGVRTRFGEYSGRILDLPEVTVAVDEARSYISRGQASYDVIQISLVDTFAASASGAFALSENALYTTEAWTSFLGRLKPSGILSVSRWWVASNPVEAYRTVTLARAALLASGVAEPSRHMIALVNATPLHKPKTGVGVVTVLIGRDRLTEVDDRRIRELAARLDFEVMLSPFGASDPTFVALANESSADMSDRLSMQVMPTTDGAPFFFYFSRFKDFVRGKPTDATSAQVTWELILLLLVLIPLSYFALVQPLVKSAGPASGDARRPLLLFFGSIGFGFMLLEVALMQWFGAFLGHPTYGLVVVLFTLLLSTGIGSAISNLVSAGHESAALWATLVVAIVVGLATPMISAQYRNAEVDSRIVAAVAALAPLGAALGMGFPLGMRLVHQVAESSSAILWGVNGAASVCSGVVAILISINTSIWTAYWCGAACYLVAVVAYRAAERERLG